MRVIISPAKKMKRDMECVEYHKLPYYIERTEEISSEMRTLTLPELKELWKCNDKIAEQNYERLQKMELKRNLTPAILSYEGIQYQYMAPAVFESDMLAYIQEHLFILSGFYGALRPMDGVTPYRLEMQAKLSVDKSKNLYEYWGKRLYEIVMDGNESRTIINLASKEYATCIERYLKAEDRYITCVFGELQNHKVVQKGTYAKMARGEMVRFLAEHQIEDIEELKTFNGLGYFYSQEYSTETSYVFLKNKECKTEL